MKTSQTRAGARTRNTSPIVRGKGWTKTVADLIAITSRSDSPQNNSSGRSFIWSVVEEARAMGGRCSEAFPRSPSDHLPDVIRDPR